MNHHAKRLIKDLESLGFTRDYDAQTNGRAYRHANQPDQVIKVFDAMTDNSITAATRKANKIADTGWSGPRQAATVKERARVTKRKQTETERRDAEARAVRAAQAQAEYDARMRAAESAKHEREIGDLMRPGNGR